MQRILNKETDMDALAAMSFIFGMVGVVAFVRLQKLTKTLKEKGSRRGLQRRVSYRFRVSLIKGIVIFLLREAACLSRTMRLSTSSENSRV